MIEQRKVLENLEWGESSNALMAFLMSYPWAGLNWQMVEIYDDVNDVCCFQIFDEHNNCLFEKRLNDSLNILEQLDNIDKFNKDQIVENPQFKFYLNDFFDDASQNAKNYIQWRNSLGFIGRQSK